MKEEFLHYIWKTKQFNPVDLKTEDGKNITVIHPGAHNHSSGPDFFNAQLIIGGMLWSGNVEIHIKASDWLKHKHQHDDAYNNVILHVVYDPDIPVQTNGGEELETLALRGRFDMKLYENYLRLRNSKTKIPCASFLAGIPPVLKAAWLSRMLAERLEQKVIELNAELGQSGNNWEEIFYRHIVRQFGMKVNAEPFQWLSNYVPYRLLRRQSDNLLQTEALLFGQSGLLPEIPADDYSRALLREYYHLKNKHKLEPMLPHWWKFMRLRPNNFPTIRIAQLAGLFFQQPQLFRTAMEEQNINELKRIFEIPASGYWNDHYRFGKISKSSVKNLGPQAVNTILVNTIVPFRFLYGKLKGDEQMRQEAIMLLENLEPETNTVISDWETMHFIPHSAAETQALLGLKTNYCDKKRCLSCEVGNFILERK